MPDSESVALENCGRPTPTVSIIIPCYNCREFVAESIESALAQTHRNVEVVVVDDGSTDGSQAVVQGYPVRFVQAIHGGVSSARNQGISASRGDYLLFLDSDDRLLPRAVEAGLAAFEREPECAMAVGAHRLVGYSGVLIATRYKPVEKGDRFELLLRSNFIECTSSILFRRSCFSGGVQFRSALRGAEDYDVYLRVARVSPICCHDEVVTEYRLHPANSSHNSRMMLTDTLLVFSEQWPFARRSLRHLKAYFIGYFSWRRKYGRQLTKEMATSDAIAPQEGRAALLLLARTYPQGILVLLISRMLPKRLVRSMLQGA